MRIGRGATLPALLFLFGSSVFAESPNLKVPFQTVTPIHGFVVEPSGAMPEDIVDDAFNRVVTAWTNNKPEKLHAMSDEQWRNVVDIFTQVAKQSVRINIRSLRGNSLGCARAIKWVLVANGGYRGFSLIVSDAVSIDQLPFVLETGFSAFFENLLTAGSSIGQNQFEKGEFMPGCVN